MSEGPNQGETLAGQPVWVPEPDGAREITVGRVRVPMSLLRRIGSRLEWGAVTLIGAAIILFLLLNLTGDPAQSYAGEKADAETVERVRVAMGFDKPVPVRVGRYLLGAMRGDLGESTLYRGEPVAKLLWQRLPATTALALAGLWFWVVVGVTVGVYTARHRDTWIDTALLIVAVLSYSVPSFWLGRVLQYLFAYQWPILPVGSVGTPAHLVLPGLTLGIVGVGYYMRLTHTAMIEALPSEYVRTARAKGLSEGAVIWRHAFRNALLPLVTALGLDVPKLLGGVVFTEAVFAWPGLGSQLVQAVYNQDIPLVMGTVLFTAALVVLANIVVDVLYHFLDPRIRDEGSDGGR